MIPISKINSASYFSRLFAVICCRRNEADLFKDFLFDVACNVSLVRILDKIVLTCFCVWPKAFFNADAAAEKADEFREKVGVHSVAFSVQSLAAWLALKHANEQLSKVNLTEILFCVKHYHRCSITQSSKRLISLYSLKS